MQYVIDSLLDEECDEIITLYDEKKQPVRYEQVAIIPFENKLYAILANLELVEQGKFDEAGEVFLIDEKNDKVTAVTNVNTISLVFEVYDRLFDEMEGN